MRSASSAFIGFIYDRMCFHREPTEELIEAYYGLVLDRSQSAQKRLCEELKQVWKSGGGIVEASEEQHERIEMKNIS